VRGGARLVLWQHERGSLAYDLVCLAILMFLILAPSGWFGDPMRVRP
jgi:hypothetical protein